VCALATHAFVYRTLWPSDGVHGYFGWYVPLVAALSLAAAAGLVGFVALAAAGAAPRHIGPGRPLADVAREIASSGLLFLLAQESLERTVEAGRPAFATFTPSQWFVLLAGIAVTALALAFALGVGAAVLARALGAPPRTARHAPMPVWSVVQGGRRSPRPLAAGHALRAPPLPAR